jgi:AraC-like DNA-binding protein
MPTSLEDLRILAQRHARGPRTETPVPRLTIHRGCEATKMRPGIYQPMLILVLQGAKEVMLGDRMLRYDPGTSAIAGLELAVSGRVTVASPERPYIGLSLDLDGDVLASLLRDLPASVGTEPPAAGLTVNPASPELLEAWMHLLGLLERPADVPVLAPLFERELLYRLLQGPQAALLRQLALADSRLSRVRRAISWIRAHFSEALRVDDLARLAGMSPASFHRHFKAATGMSPLQFQKNLRLQHARTLLIGRCEAARAAFAVGYESPSQFSREYARLFGAPPARDAQRLRGEGAAFEPVGA